ncbi:DUF7619 domain-containing protein [Sanyastnella coralliicola]|uniref:DUF7619 domain-containing protein n=1 Tax=Sanyastnella coralliicola TaxID=3069118 RepID=UPI0027B90C08|nr:FG-GAP-like repeat-containing protein [Longitalea sp. SCSIO 12813]
MKTFLTLLLSGCALLSFAQFNTSVVLMESSLDELFRPSNAVIGDLNNDSFNDVIAAPQGVAFLGDGTGNFQKLPPIEGNLKLMELADLDLDGDLDIIGTNYENQLIIYTNDGSANFLGPIPSNESLDEINAIEVLDINQDDYPDIAISNGAVSGLYSLLNDQNGQFFEQELIFEEAINTITDLSSGNLNGDDFPDLIWSYNSNSEIFHQINSIGSFAFPISITEFQLYSSEFTIADINNDDLDDIIALDPSASWKFINNGDGSFSAEEFEDDNGASAPQVIDIDGDDSLELFYKSNGQYSLHSIDENGNISPSESITVLYGGSSIFAFGNFNGDPALEMFSCMNSADFLMYYSGESFTDGKIINTDLDLQEYYTYQVADLSNDGTSDIVFNRSSLSGPKEYSLDESLEVENRRIHSASGDNNFTPIFLDLDDDGDLDMVYPYGIYIDSEHIGIKYRTEEGGYASIGNISGNSPHPIELNGDEHTDLIYNTQWTTTTTVRQNLGDEAFTNVNELMSDNGDFFDFNFGDIDNDGLNDIISYKEYFGGQCDVWRNLGNFQFELVVSDFNFGNDFAMLFDINGDGFDDIVYTPVYSDPGIFARISNGDGSFQNPIAYTEIESVEDITVLDWNLDGLDDLILHSDSEIGTWLLLNNGDGTYQEETFLNDYTVLGSDPTFVDIDLDGDIDLVQRENTDNSQRLVAYISNISQGCTDPTACNYEPFYLDDDGSCCYGTCGCLDPESCNYDPAAECVVTCVYPGCTDDTACNYNPQAGCDDGSCAWEGSISGFVFHDLDGDNFFENQGFFELESGLTNWSVTIEELNWVGFTNGDGYFTFNDVPFGEYTVSLVQIQDGWVAPNGGSFTVVIDECGNIEENIAVEWDSDANFWVSGPINIWNTNLHCDDGMNPGIWVQNTGGIPLNGEVTISFNPDLVATELGGEAETPDLIEEGVVSWVLDGEPQPGQDLLYQFHIEGPGVDLIGQIVPIEMTLTLVDENDVEYYTNTWTLYPEVVCAYDPNDKYTEFPGYIDQHHFVLKEDEMEYRIRFQNTGNFPAENVIIRDTLDIAHLDLSTFQPIFGSHDFTTCVKPDGAVEFNFADIQLPDSTCCFDESQGYVVYRITPREDAQAGDIINNTAHIFFDNNPAIITNTTWHTIYECSDDHAAFTTDNDFCVGEVIDLVNDYPYVEEYIWTVDGQVESNEAFISINSDEPATFEVSLEISNPLCQAMTNEVINVHENPELLEITADGFNTLYTDEIEGYSYQWYLNGEAMEGENSEVLFIEEDGLYALEITNEFGCSVITDEEFFMYVGVEEFSADTVKLYPNPSSGQIVLEFENASQRSIEIYSSTGQLVHSQVSLSDIIQLDLSALAKGSYSVKVTSQESYTSGRLIIK